MLFRITLFSRLYVRVCILLIREMHLHDRIISLRWEVWVHETSLTPATFHWGAVPSHESERSCICVLRVSILVLEWERECLLSVVSYLIHSWFFLSNYYAMSLICLCSFYPWLGDGGGLRSHKTCSTSPHIRVDVQSQEPHRY